MKTRNYPELTDADRTRLFDVLEALPDTVGYVLNANTDRTISLTISGKRGHGSMPRLFVRGSAGAVIRDARDYLTLLRLTGRIPSERQQTLEDQP